MRLRQPLPCLPAGRGRPRPSFPSFPRHAPDLPFTHVKSPLSAPLHIPSFTTSSFLLLVTPTGGSNIVGEEALIT